MPFTSVKTSSGFNPPAANNQQGRGISPLYERYNMAKEQSENNAKPLPAAAGSIKSTHKTKPNKAELAKWKARFGANGFKEGLERLVLEQRVAKLLASQDTATSADGSAQQ